MVPRHIRSKLQVERMVIPAAGRPPLVSELLGPAEIQ
jgi:hypothetical protein